MQVRTATMKEVFDQLELLVSEMPIGITLIYETKADIKEAIYSRTGHYPKQREFDWALETLLKTRNQYNFGYLKSVGWFRSKSKTMFTKHYDTIIRSNQLKKQAIGVH